MSSLSKCNFRENYILFLKSKIYDVYMMLASHNSYNISNTYFDTFLDHEESAYALEAFIIVEFTSV